MSNTDDLIGKTIVRAEIRKYKKTDFNTNFYSLDEINDWDDEPILEIETDNGEVFLIEATYGGYTGKSRDEYPSFIKIIKQEVLK